MRLFLDLDGVLADFDRGYENAFGIECSIARDNVDWKRVAEHPNFFAALPMTEDGMELFAWARPLSPQILTGTPASIPWAGKDKRAWVAEHLGADVPVNTCASKDKCMYAAKGDVLVDDWEKYRQRWLDHGGQWITHTSAANSIRQLKQIFGN